MPETLAQLVRKKYPGAYDDLSDADLEAKIDAKYPGTYSDLPRSTAVAAAAAPSGASPAPASPWQERSGSGILRNAGQSMLGAVKGAAETAYATNPVTMGSKLAQWATGGQAPPGEAEMIAALQPANEAQAVGRGVERMAEYAAPGGPARGVAGAVFQGARGAATALAQGETPRGALVAGATSAAGPLTVKLGEKLVPFLRESAERQMARVLGATTNENKAISDKIVPDLLERGVTGASRKSLLKKVTAKLSKTGFDLDKELDKIPQGQRVDTAPIIKHLEDAKQAFIVDGVVHDAEAVARFEVLQKTIAEYGPDVSFRSLRRVRQVFDRVVAQARGFHGKTLAEGSTIESKRELANAIRAELAKAAPDLAKVNKEYSFWSNVEKVLGDTVERTQPQSKPLGEQLIRAAAVTGGLGGVATGTGGTAVPLAVALAVVNKAVRTTAWNSTSAVTKHRIADLIAAGRFDEAAAMASRIGGGGAAATQ
jgi:hypothetical protein